MLTSIILSMAMSASPAPVVDTQNIIVENIDKKRLSVRIDKKRLSVRIDKKRLSVRIDKKRLSVRI